MAAVEERREVRAEARYVRAAPRKAQVVVEQIRGRTVPEARAILAFMTRDAARDVERVLSSAVANAEANHGLVGDDLYVSHATAGAGPTLKRWRARARGRVARIKKRTCHIRIELAETEGLVAAPPAEEKLKRAPRKKAEPAEPPAAAEPAPEPEPEPVAPGPENPVGAVETQTVTPEPPAPPPPAPVVPEPPAPEPEPVSPLSAAPEPPEPEPVPTAVEPEPEPVPEPEAAPAPALAERPREAALERFSEGWLIDGTLVQPRRARLRRYVITEELVLEQDGTESSRIVGKEPYPDDPEES